jgi:hypothetical protein
MRTPFTNAKKKALASASLATRTISISEYHAKGIDLEAEILGLAPTTYMQSSGDAIVVRPSVAYEASNTYQIVSNAPDQLNFNAPLFSELGEILISVSSCIECSQYSLNNLMAAGGCVRDSLLGREVKDIDIFLHDTLDNSKFAKELKARGWDVSYEDNGGDYDNANGIKKVHTFEDNRGVKRTIQVIETKLSLKSCLNSFAVNLSKVAYLGSMGLHLTQDFLQDWHGRMLTVNDPDATDYVDRIAKKYSSYTIVNDFKARSTCEAAEEKIDL